MTEYTPMINQYLEIKEKHKDCLLFFRLGDFYELFFEDALKAVEVLDITLTKKFCGKKDGKQLKVDMCGVPHHSAETYIARLVAKGYKVAICEQTETPKEALGRVVKREVTRIITAGTILDTNVLDANKNNYIMSIFENNKGLSLAVCDISTGEFLTTYFEKDEKFKIMDEIAKLKPAEIIASEKLTLSYDIQAIFDIKVCPYSSIYFELEGARETILNHFNINNLSCFNIEKNELLISVCGALLSYLKETQKTFISHILKIRTYSYKDCMFLDLSSRRNLELVENINGKSKKASLLWILDKTKTPMGARLIRKWIEEPLIDKEQINKRLDSVEFLKNNAMLKEELKEHLVKIKDIERLLAKISFKTVTPKDLNVLKVSFKALSYVKKYLKDCDVDFLKEIESDFDSLSDLYEKIENTILEEPATSIKEGNIIKKGFNEEIDKLHLIKREGSSWLSKFELEEREKTGIKNLKVKSNKVFGYYIEVTNVNLSLVPDYYIRKQTLVNGERFVTEKLKKIEETILGADEKVNELEFEEFCKLRTFLEENTKRIQLVANYIAIIDCILSFAEVAETNNYTRPQIIEDEDNTLEIELGRHPVVEALLKEQFIPNDTILDTHLNRLAIITGPNMAGKSTYMRQVALIVLMAQIGCFVPARSVKLSLVDRIFTRVGASDDLATGQSTFMVEMSELANILNNATKKSLLILDEIGRGTSTFDGLSIAWSVLEYIADKEKLGARTLFATHYHEITALEGKIEGINNYYSEIKETDGEIIFIRKIARGSSKGSYGIHVAKMAGLPNEVIERANEIIEALNINEANYNSLYSEKSDIENFSYDAKMQKNVFFIDEISKELKGLNIKDITPIEAMNKLLSLKSRFEKL